MYGRRDVLAGLIELFFLGALMGYDVTCMIPL